MAAADGNGEGDGEGDDLLDAFYGSGMSTVDGWVNEQQEQ
jgi:hypothetical protein